MYSSKTNSIFLKSWSLFSYRLVVDGQLGPLLPAEEGKGAPGPGTDVMIF
jgi:hypothetical protein